MKYVYLIIFILLLILILVKPYICVSEANYDYGELGRNKSNIGEIYVLNKGVLPLRIKECVGCCGLEVSCDKNILKHNEKAKITFDYNSLEVSPGVFNKTIVIINNDIYHKNKIINITGIVVGEPVLE